ncbi:cation-transporting ATPase [Microbacterium sp. SLBN-146]|uniref:cation-transporting ATPase n=1 Tax=Microbacterium sp. SLBN-146 TaxID=2768457 RepID=UPI00114DC149|nr:cation-transporting ATPase [Microbacterium sp. SLBN-146]TQJ31276.1 hypothetical protein FBY39_1739 [Microbacterium sp. SLBN-146]
MSKLNRLFDLASKALDKGDKRSGSAGSGTDWRGMVRSATDALSGDSRRDSPAPATSPRPATGLTPPASNPPTAGSGSRANLTPPSAFEVSPADRAAIARYDYLLQTADPHQVEMIHRDAFERLTPEQRALVERRMQTELPPHERPRSASASDLARAAGRTEATSPGRMRGLLSRAGRAGAVVGAGGAVVGVLGAVAGGAILSSVAGPLLEQAAGWGVDFDTLAAGVDVESIAGDALGGVGDAVGGIGETVGGVGEQVGSWGEQLGGFEIPGLGDFFGR